MVEGQGRIIRRGEGRGKAEEEGNGEGREEGGGKEGRRKWGENAPTSVFTNVLLQLSLLTFPVSAVFQRFEKDPCKLVICCQEPDNK